MGRMKEQKRSCLGRGKEMCLRGEELMQGTQRRG